MVRLAHAHAVDTRPSFPRREEPGDEATTYCKIAKSPEYAWNNVRKS